MGSGFVTLAHGSGGVESFKLLEELLFSRVEDRFKRVEGGVGIDKLDDGAAIPLPDGRYLVVSIDAYTVNPPFFPGGNIGVLAAAGTINDVLMMGAKPLAMLDSIVVEEGFPLRDLEAIIESLVETLRREGVALVGGDFKVMPKGQVGGIVVTTAGIGVAERLIVDEPKPGDKLVVSGCVGDHGAVIALLQSGLWGSVKELSEGLLRSDVKPLTRLMLPLLEKYGWAITAARDPTRGGLAGVLNEWASRSGTVIVVEESSIPVREPVKRYAEMLGIDPLYLASEGTAVLAVKPEAAEEVVEYMRGLGFEDARVFGEVRYSEKYRGFVLARTSVGGHRIIEPPSGELIPRIC
ncbi:MAG: hydrogenase expression/formation protein HypE [Thermofilaceae archaeon]